MQKCGVERDLGSLEELFDAGHAVGHIAGNEAAQGVFWSQESRMTFRGSGFHSEG